MAESEVVPGSRRISARVACPPKSGPVIMQIVQLAETGERLHAKEDQPRPDRLDPPGHPGRPRRRIERQPGVPQGLPLNPPPPGGCSPIALADCVAVQGGRRTRTRAT